MSDGALKRVLAHCEAGCRARQEFFQRKGPAVVEAARAIAARMAAGGKLLICGNGGSAADAQHLATTFVNRFRLERPPLPAVALTTDTSALTSIGNDYGFEQIFLKQVQAIGRQGDVLLALSTSGGSPNVLNALRAARDKGLYTIGLTGGGGSGMSMLCDLCLAVPAKDAAIVQEVNVAVCHMLCELTDYFLFEAVGELSPQLLPHT